MFKVKSQSDKIWQKIIYEILKDIDVDIANQYYKETAKNPEKVNYNIVETSYNIRMVLRRYLDIDFF